MNTLFNIQYLMQCAQNIWENVVFHWWARTGTEKIFLVC